MTKKELRKFLEMKKQQLNMIYISSYCYERDNDDLYRESLEKEIKDLEYKIIMHDLL